MFTPSNDLQPFNWQSSEIQPHQFSWTINVRKSPHQECGGWNIAAWSQQMAETPKPLKWDRKSSFPQRSFSFSMEFQLTYNAKRIKSAASYYTALAENKMGMNVGCMPQLKGKTCTVFPTEGRNSFHSEHWRLRSSCTVQVHCQQTDGLYPHPIFCVHLMLSVVRACLVYSGSGMTILESTQGPSAVLGLVNNACGNNSGTPLLSSLKEKLSL